LGYRALPHDRTGKSERHLGCVQRHLESVVMMLNQWQLAFLHRLVELGGFISVPGGVVNQELIELIEADYVLDGSGGSSRTRYEITEAGRAAIKSSPDG
jgi:hypothetical protein